MLVGDAGFRCLPTLTESVQKREDHLRQREWEREGSEQLVERRLGHRLVERLDALCESGLDLGEARRVPAWGRFLARLGQPGGLGGGQPGGDVLAHEVDAPLVLFGEETQPARGAVRAQKPVAHLPGAQQLGAHTGASTELADAQSWTVAHNWSLPNLYRTSTKTVYWNRMTLKAIIDRDPRCTVIRIRRA